MRHPRKRKDKDRSKIIVNENIIVAGIPSEAWEYVINGKPAIAWVMERQCVRTDKDSGIVNDANRYAMETMGDPAWPLKLLAKIIRVSIKTTEIVRSLPEPEWRE